MRRVGFTPIAIASPSSEGVIMNVLRIGSRAIAAAVAIVGVSSSAIATDAGFDCGSGDGHGYGRKSLRIVGLTSEGALLCFNEHAPRASRTIGYVNGLVEDTALVGIDFRVQDGLLYGVGNLGGIYTLDTSNGYASLVSRLTVPLAGESFGVDFNPAADRLRVVSDTGQNLRHNVNAGGVTIVDGTLNYTMGTAATGVVGVAYTNNDLVATTATTLFDLDTNLNQIALQSPPNNGSLAATGQLGIDADAVAGFDIYSTLRGGSTASNRGFAVFGVGGISAFYRVNLLTGNATFVGKFKQGVTDIAVPLNQ
jgi:hypothetical protein